MPKFFCSLVDAYLAGGKEIVVIGRCAIVAFKKMYPKFVPGVCNQMTERLEGTKIAR
jgi:hypothetical protein